MAFSWNIDTSENVEFDEFVAFFTAQGPRVLEDDLDASARMMRRLANNRRFLVERLNEELAALDNLKSFQSNNLYTPQVFLLHADPSFFVRVCVWEPLRKRPGETLFFYESAHDHNFSFMTVGYHGSGYRTEIAEYDPATLLGYVDEPVPMRFLEETTLPLGKVMFFQPEHRHPHAAAAGGAEHLDQRAQAAGQRATRSVLLRHATRPLQGQGRQESERDAGAAGGRRRRRDDPWSPRGNCGA
jgi:hypothetical protein